jgi:hypothetical protein
MSVIRQGDVCLVRVSALPKDAVEQPIRDRKLTLAFGEATGHHHRFEFMDTTQNARLYVAHGGARYLHVTEPVNLLHEEHSTARVGAGFWLLPTQVEYTPKELVRVKD